MKVLRKSDVQLAIDTLTVEDLLSCSSRALVASSRKQCICPPRISIANAHFTSLHMPSELDSIIFEKVVSVPRSGNGLPASIQVLDAQTGALRCLMNAAMLTAVRTAAASLLASKQVEKADPDWRPKSMWVFGTGEQAFQHARLHLMAFDSLTDVTIVARTKNAQYDKMMQRLEKILPHLKQGSSVVMRGVTEVFVPYLCMANIICCCIPSTAPLFSQEVFLIRRRRKHVNLIGSFKPTMREVDSGTMFAADAIWTDSTDDCMREAGELITAVEEGLDESKIRELGSVVNSPLQLGENSVTIFKCVGMSVMDNAIAQVILKKAMELQIGLDVDDF